MERIERETKHPETFDGNFHKVSNWCQRVIIYFDNRKINDSEKQQWTNENGGIPDDNKIHLFTHQFLFHSWKSIIQMMEES